MSIKVLSLWQPWATLMALGVKVVETRGWETRYRGQLLIHASKRVVGRRGERWTIGKFEVERDAAGYLLRGPSLSWPYRLPLGALVAKTNLVDVLPIIDADDRIDQAWQPHIAPTRPSGSELWIWLGPSDTENLSTGRPTWRHQDITDEAAYGDYSPGRFGWVTEEPWPLKSPIPMRGRQGLFNVPDDVLQHLGRQLAVAEGVTA